MGDDDLNSARGVIMTTIYSAEFWAVVATCLAVMVL